MRKDIFKILSTSLILFIMILLIPSIRVNALASNYRQYNGNDYIYTSMVGSINEGAYGGTSIAGNYGSLDGNGGNKTTGYSTSYIDDHRQVQYYFAKYRYIDIGRIINKSRIESIEIRPTSQNRNTSFYIADNDEAYKYTGTTFTTRIGEYCSPIYISGANLPVSNVRYMRLDSDSCTDGAQIIIHIKRDTIAPNLDLMADITSWTNSNVTITAYASDNVAVEGIQTPDGNWIYSSSVKYTVSSNGTYSFSARDTSGNVRRKSINISNIDKYSPTASSLSIQNADENGYDVYVYGVSDKDSGINRVQFPTWTDYNGQDDVISDWPTNPSATGQNLGNGTWKYHVYKQQHNNEYGNYNTHVYIYDNAGNYKALGTSIVLKPNDSANITSNDIPTSMEAGQTYTVHITATNTGMATWRESGSYRLGAVGDSDPFAYPRQYLSSGVSVYPGNSYTFPVTMKAPTTPGVHTTHWQMVHDGVTWFGDFIYMNIVVKDTTVPNISFDINNFDPNIIGWTQSQKIVINASDSGSGVNQIVLPNGNIIKGTTATYIVNENGPYNFTAIDNSGNQITKSVTVSNIDKTAPGLIFTTNTTSWVNSNITITATGSDTQSGVKRIKLPNDTYVNSSTAIYVANTNGTYEFVVEDNVGNTYFKAITISNIDKTPPTLKLSLESDLITNKTVTINAVASDDESGVKSITKPDGTIVNSSNTTYTVDKNGTYSFIVTDSVGNMSTVSISVNNIISINTVSGIDHIEYKLEGATVQDWTTYNSLTIVNEGITTIYARAVDKAGNYSDVATSVVKLDRTAPINNTIKIVTN